jgi:hypothetical protein
MWRLLSNPRLRRGSEECFNRRVPFRTWFKQPASPSGHRLFSPELQACNLSQKSKACTRWGNLLIPKALVQSFPPNVLSGLFLSPFFLGPDSAASRTSPWATFPRRYPRSWLALRLVLRIPNIPQCTLPPSRNRTTCRNGSTR